MAVAAGGPGLSVGQLVVLVVAIVLLFLVGRWLLQYLRERSAKPRAADGRIRTDSLLAVWRAFLDKQPPVARPLITRYPWVVVLGESGSGKTTLIDTKADCKSQLLNDFPSHTDDPLLKLYLGRRTVVQELSAELLSDNSVGVKLALSALWKPLCRIRPPLAVIVLSRAQLAKNSPAELRSEALRLASRLKLLGRLCSAPILTRVCLTHLDEDDASGDSESLARLLHDRRIPLSLDLSRPSSRRATREVAAVLSERSESRASAPRGPLATSFLHYAGYLKFALPALPAVDFEQMVAALASAPQSLRPVETLLAELEQACAAGMPRATAAMQLDKLYLLPRSPDLQRANPLLIAGIKPPLLTPALHLRGWRGLWLALRTSNILSSWHAALCLAIIATVGLLCGSLYFNHRQAVQEMGKHCTQLVEYIAQAKASSGRPGDSPVVWRNAHQAAASLQLVAEAERVWPLLSRTLQAEKTAARGQFVESVRRLYLEPVREDNLQLAADGSAALQLDLAKPTWTAEDLLATETAMTKVIHSLGVWNASRHNALGVLISKDPPRWASLLEIPQETLLAFIEVGPGCALPARGKRPQTSGGQSSLTSQASWFAFIEHLKSTMSRKPEAATTAEPAHKKSRHSKPPRPPRRLRNRAACRGDRNDASGLGVPEAPAHHRCQRGSRRSARADLPAAG